jgi:hypothetical protein
MADRYWVGGSGTWNGINTTNWSTTPGGAGGASIPTGSDNVIFNSASSASSYSVVVDLNDAPYALDLTISAPASGTLSFSSTGTSFYLRVQRNITTAASGVSLISFSGTILFEGFTAADISFGTALTNGSIRVESTSGATKRLVAPLVCTNLTLGDQAGKLTTNGYDITCSGLLQVGSTFGGSSGFVTNSTESIYLTGNNQTIYALVSNANANTGTVNLRCTYAGSTGTRTFDLANSPTEVLPNGAPNIYISAGSDTVSIFNTFFDVAQNVDFTGFSGSISGAGSCNVWGNLTFSSGMTISGFTGSIALGALTGNTSTLITAGKSCAFGLYFETATGYLGGAQLGGSFTTSKEIGLFSSATFNTQGYAVTSSNFNQTFGTVVLGATTWTLTGSGTALNLGASSTLSLGTSTFVFTSASTKTATVNANNLPSITQAGAGQLILTYTGPINIANLTTTVAPTSLRFTSSQTATITGNFNVSGTPGNLVTITSSTSGTAATLSKSSGVVSSNYLSLKDSTATGGATWYAGSNSTNVSGNTGWIFANAAGGGMLFFFN